MNPTGIEQPFNPDFQPAHPEYLSDLDAGDWVPTEDIVASESSMLAIILTSPLHFSQLAIACQRSLDEISCDRVWYASFQAMLSTPKMGTSRLSVIITAFHAKDTIGVCLKSLEQQTQPGCFEIILVESSGDGTADLVHQHFPDVKVISFDQRKFCGDARNIGIAAATADIVAFIDADCQADPTWVEEILKAHQKPPLAIGGAIANGSTRSVVEWAAYFTEFSKWLPNFPPRKIADIPGANMSYKKKVFDTYGRFIEGTYCSDTEFHWRLAKDGLSLDFVPSIVVSHYSIGSLGLFLSHEVFHGRSFARVRSKARQFSPFKRLFYTVTSPLIAIKLLVEVGLCNLRNRIYLRPFLKSFPLIALGIGAWCLGEAVGYLEEA